jgi:glycosyltransferase involved in cell wall biosynthesis
MKISIIVPSYNQALYLPATLQSLSSQRYPDLEVRVYDGGSTDGSVDVLKISPDVFWWVSERDGGQAAAINRGLQEATGDILAFLNSDDIYFPGALARVADYFHLHPECLILYGDAQHLHADGSVMEPYYTEPWDYARLASVCYLCQPAVFWRREIIERFGLLDDRLHFAFDYEYWLRIGRHVPFHYLQGSLLAGSRLHGETKTLSMRAKVHREILDVVLRHEGSEPAVLGWLGHLAFHEASELADATATTPLERRRWVAHFVGATLRNAARLGLRLPVAKLSELERHLAAAGG